ARTLTDAGYEVTVVADAGDGLPERESRDGYRVLRVVRPIRRLPLIRFFAYGRRLVDTLVTTRPDILHAHDSDALRPVALAAARLNIPFVYDAHELWLGQLRRGRGRPYWSAFMAYYAFIERRYLRRAAAWLTVSPPIARHLERRYRLSQVHLVANYPDIDRIPPRRELRDLPGGAAIPADAPVLLYLGALMPGRGIEQLLHAMPSLPRAHLVLLGRGGHEPQLRQLTAELDLADRVHFLAPVPPSDVVSYAQSATIGIAAVLPSGLSYAYSLPNKLFESMAAGLPVVASDFPQVRDVVLGAQAGVTVDGRSSEALAAALRGLLDDPEGARQMGANGQRAVVTRYNWSASAAELLDVYATLCERRGTGARRRRLLAFTRIWPTAEQPAAGIFVKNRFRGVPGVRVVVAREQRHWALTTLRFIVDGVLTRGRFDGVEAHVLYPAGLVGLIVARLRRVPLIAYAHGTDVRDVPNRGPLYRSLVRLVARQADLLVTNSDDTARLIRRLGADARVIPPGIDTDLFRPTPRRSQGARRVLYLGGTNPRKGYDVARRLADTLVGPGLEEVTPQRVAQLISEHDVVLVPSLAEPFGLVAVEAIASGRWVVATDVGGLPNIVKDGVNGTLVRDGEFAAALASVPDYDPYQIAPTVLRFSLDEWQAAMRRAWDELLGET
ncbi:MAG TPA: glycosyltransferase, partial [Candidatus Limnocylindria bacterium]|nr:glycosyltransferase [Candidatus Limnocylindria bacterium]